MSSKFRIYPLQQLGDAIPVSLHGQEDRSVGFVSDPSNQSEGIGERLDGPTEAHPLHLAVVGDSQVLHSAG